MRNASVVGRIAGIAAVTLAVVAVVYVLMSSSGGSITVTADFQNASQLVKGDLVQIAGQPVGKVKDITLTADGQAAVKMTIQSSFKLRDGTQADVRQASLSGIANRYIDLTPPPFQPGQRTLGSGAIIDAAHTTSAVDLDQLFNVFGPQQRKALSDVIRGSATEYGDRGPDVNAGIVYLNPVIASSSRLLGALGRDRGLLTNFVVSSSQLVNTLADRHDAISGLIDHLATTTQAIGSRRDALSRAVGTLPSFMRRADTTFVNLRATLDDVDRLTADSKPVARKLGPLLAQLRGLSHDAVPTLRDLDVAIRRPGANNDLIDLANSAIPLRNIAIGPVTRNGASRPGAFPASTQALAEATPEVAFLRPYSPDLESWFKSFGTSGLYDAWGVSSRPALYVNAFAIAHNLLSIVPPAQRATVAAANNMVGQNSRCPGSMERNNAFKPTPDFNCDLSQVPPGP